MINLHNLANVTNRGTKVAYYWSCKSIKNE